MKVQQDVMIVSAPNVIGEAFIRQLIRYKIPFAAITNNKIERERLKKMGVEKTLMVGTTDERTWVIPAFPVGKIILFESSLNLSCRYLRICRTWTSEPIYIITHSSNPRSIYKGLGASYVIHTRSQDASFLVSMLVDK
ncbi:hypothetical protein J2T13_005059 [Paenibacillus sp. DS2015]|uniref:hypothetical protein n=1 Tax=Paenibacillus sp. DS2015 TaxID=3373917 RepID=UPI003D1E6CBA